jgi:hypothetical protein
MDGALKQEKVTTAQDQTQRVLAENVLFSLCATLHWLVVPVDASTELIPCSMNRKNIKKL